MIQKGTCTPVFTASVFTTAKTGRQPECPSIEQRMKRRRTGINGTLLGHRKNETVPAAAVSTDREIIIPSELSQVISLM